MACLGSVMKILVAGSTVHICTADQLWAHQVFKRNCIQCR